MLVEAHALRFKELSQEVRLKELGYSLSAYAQLRKYVRERKKKESQIPYSDYDAALRQVVEFPYLGGVKGSLMLLAEEKAMLGSTFYAEIKQELKYLAEEELQVRKQQTQLEKNQYSRKNSQKQSFEKMKAEAVDDIWAIDFVELWLLGIKFVLCVVYEVYSQSYLSIVPAFEATKEVAVEAMEEAFNCRKTTPKKCIIFDGGSQFGSADFKKVLQTRFIRMNQTPPGTPWNNGALESGNRDLKKALYTHIFYEASSTPAITKRGVERKYIFKFLRCCCSQVKEIINGRIVRPKFNVTPKAVITNAISSRIKSMNAYRAMKVKERATIPEREKGTKEQKIRKAWSKLKKELSSEKLFAFTEAVNGRFQAIRI